MTRYDPDLPDSVSIDLIRLRPSIKRTLLAAGFKTVGDVRKASDEVLLSIQNLGNGSLTRLRNALPPRDPLKTPSLAGSLDRHYAQYSTCQP